jgi:hypothetical protein
MASEVRIGRRTPYEAVFGVDRLGELEFPAIVEEAARRAVRLGRRDEFAGLERVGALLRRVVPDETEPAALDLYLEILFHCFHFWRHGCRMYACEEAVARALVETPPALGDRRLSLPHPSFYLELPANLFWATVEEDRPPEPAEGLFVQHDPDRPSPDVQLLLVLGMRAGRPGFSAVGLVADLEVAAPLEEPGAFGPEIPGADLAGLYSLRTSSEVVLLLLRLLWYLETYPESLEPLAGAVSGEAPPADRDLLTSLDHFRVRLVERSRG